MRFGGTLRVANHLCDAVTVAHIEKDQATMIAASIHPTRQRHLLSTMLCRECTACMCAKMRFKTRYFMLLALRTTRATGLKAGTDRYQLQLRSILRQNVDLRALGIEGNTLHRIELGRNKLLDKLHGQAWACPRGCSGCCRRRC